MKSIEEKADKINSILSTEYLRNRQIKDIDFIKNNLHKAVVVSHTNALQQMIRRTIHKESKCISKKTFSVVQQSKEGTCSLMKGVENAKKCHGNHSFRLFYLERLLFEDQINLRKFKQLKAVLVKTQLQMLSELSKRSLSKHLNAKAINSVLKSTDNHINPYYK